jgi:hypothetical protein
MPLSGSSAGVQVRSICAWLTATADRSAGVVGGVRSFSKWSVSMTVPSSR